MDVVIIEVNKRTKAGKALIETARLMSQKFKGISISEENAVLVTRIKQNHRSDLVSEPEKSEFISELRNIAG